MIHHQFLTPVIGDESLAWVPLVPCINDVVNKYLKTDPIGDVALAIDPSKESK